MSYSEVIEEAGDFRVRLELDEDAVNPREDGDGFMAGVVTTDADGYLPVADPAGDDRVRDAWERLQPRFNRREFVGAWAEKGEDILCRYIRILGGVAELDTPNDGPRSIWYVLPEKWAELMLEPFDADKARKSLEAERQEYRSWAEGDVYGYVVEEKATWHRTDGDGIEVDTRETWEHVDSCWGFIGREYAEQEAREALASYTETGVK